MIAIAGSLGELASNLWPAAVLGLASAALLRLLGLARTIGALIAGAAIAAAFLPAGWAPALHLAMGFVLAGLLARAVARRERPDAGRALALAVLPAALPWGLLLDAQSVYWLAAISASVAAGTGVALLEPVRSDRTQEAGLRVLTLTRTDVGRGWRGTGVAAAGAAVVALAGLAYPLDLLGPGDPALVALGSWLAIAAVAAVRDRIGPMEIAAGAFCGAVLGTLAVAAIP